MDAREFEVSLTLESGYRFAAEFGLAGVSPLVVDEPPPLGESAGPNPARLLAVSIGNCLASSLLFCLQKAQIPVTGLKVAVTGTTGRNPQGRYRIGSIHVRLQPEVAEADRERMGRCLGLFEDFCIVTQSVRAGLDVEVEVESETAAGVS